MLMVSCSRPAFGGATKSGHFRGALLVYDITDLESFRCAESQLGPDQVMTGSSARRVAKWVEELQVMAGTFNLPNCLLAQAVGC